MLLKVVNHYDLSILSISVMGFQKKFGGWAGCSIQFIGIFLTLESH